MSVDTNSGERKQTIAATSATQSLPKTLASGDSASGDIETVASTSARGTTVLPDVHSEGAELVIKPRNQVRYQHDSFLGRGGMGVVQLARDNDIGRQVAVKRLIDASNPQAISRFVDEVRTVGSLEHPNIVPVHDVGVDENGALYFVMKYVEGDTLATVISSLAAGDAEYHRRYTFETRLDCFAGILRALQYAHGQGLIHRDVKPANIIVGRFGEVMLMDWGVARRGQGDDLPAGTAARPRASTETVDGTVVGTPHYMSPEQAAGETTTLDCRSDLYSAFVVLFELLTTRPFVDRNKNTKQVIQEARDRRPPSVADAVYESPHQAAVPADLRHFLRRGLATAREERFADSIEVLAHLNRIRSGDCAVQCPITFVKATNTRFQRFMEGHPVLGMLVVVLATLSCASGVFTWGRWLFS